MRTIQTSFAGGEISPELSGRIDLRQFASGASKLLNFLPLPQGPATRRPGSRFVSGQHTSGTYSTQLIPFVYSTDDALCLEMIYASGSGFIRIYDNGAPVRWSQPIDLGESGWDLVANTARFDDEHGLIQNDQVRVTVPMPIGGSGSLPGLDTGVTYFVDVVDSYTIRLKASESSGIISLSGGPSGYPSGYVRFFKAAGFPATWLSSLSGQAYTSSASNARWDAVAHGYIVGDVVRFTSVSSGVTAANWIVNRNYYISEVGTDWFKVSATRNGDSLVPNQDYSGNVTRYYVQGESVWWNGSASIERGVLLCKVDHAPLDVAPAMANWFVQPYDGTLVIETPYTNDKQPAISYAQSNDVMTFVDRSFAPMELRRFGNSFWDLRPIAFTGAQRRPNFRYPTPVESTRGEAVNIYAVSTSGASGANPGVASFVAGQFASLNNNGPIQPQENLGLSVGDVLWLGAYTPGSVSVAPDLEVNKFYIIAWISNQFFQLRNMDGTWLQRGASALQFFNPGSILFYPSSLSSEIEQKYVCTAVSPDGIESIASQEVTAINNLDTPGASNLLFVNIAATDGAEKFRIYKNQNGLFGLIGQINSTDPEITGWGHLGFTDDGITPDMSISPPILDDSLSGSDYPRAVAYFEQRRCFGGTGSNPRQLLMSKSGTESDFSYSLPVRDDDRISIKIASREAATVRHLVPMGDLLLITQQGEWKVTAQNSDAITPETIAVRQQSEIGGNHVQPIVVNTSVVYAANRGGHVRNMIYSQEVQGYATGDLSLRSSHLFDGLTIQDATYSKAPYPVLWFASSSGKLLSLTYVPEQEIAGWAAHDLGGKVLSVCSVPEGREDSLYLIVERTVNGATEKHVERIIPQVVQSLTESVFVDAATSYDGLETKGRTIELTESATWAAGDSVQLKSSGALFSQLRDVGDVIELRNTAGDAYRVTITSCQSSLIATGKLMSDVPNAMRRTAVTLWAFARKSILVGSHLEGQTVQVVSDGVPQTPLTVSGGKISLASPGCLVHAGYGFTSDLETLPVAFGKVEAFGQGRVKNIGKAFVRLLDCAGLTVGPDADRQVPIEGVGVSALASGEKRAVPDGSWSESGKLVLRQSGPQPATILGLTLEVEVGD